MMVVVALTAHEDSLRFTHSGGEGSSLLHEGNRPETCSSSIPHVRSIVCYVASDCNPQTPGDCASAVCGGQHDCGLSENVTVGECCGCCRGAGSLQGQRHHPQQYCSAGPRCPRHHGGGCPACPTSGSVSARNSAEGKRGTLIGLPADAGRLHQVDCPRKKRAVAGSGKRIRKGGRPDAREREETRTACMAGSVPRRPGQTPHLGGSTRLRCRNLARRLFCSSLSS